MIIDESQTAKGFTPNAQVAAVFGRPRTIEGIVVHHWGLPGQTHDSVVDFFVNGPGATSAHFVASAGRVNCLVSPEDAAWHCPGKNSSHIGIECRPEASDEDYRTVSDLVRTLREQHGPLPLSMHRDWYATACPGVWDLGRIDRLAQQTITTQAAAAPEEEEDMPSAKEIADEIFSRPFARGGAGVSGFTDLGGLVAWNDAWNTGLVGEIAALRELVNQLAVKQGVTIDYDLIAEKSAKAVNDDAAKRLAK